jgi:hypothetical protein
VSTKPGSSEIERPDLPPHEITRKYGGNQGHGS